LKKNHSFLKSFLLAAVWLLLLTSCSTQKNNFTNRTYHRINAKYNGFFNARESYREGMMRLANQHVDNYEQVLSIFRYGTDQQAASVSNQMEVAYQKASLVIRKHSMNIRGVEHNPWIDQSYFIIARSHFFKQDYSLAILTFEYIIRQYDTEVSFASKVWLAKCYHAMGRNEQALQALELVGEDKRNGLLTKEVSALFFLTYADHYIRKDDYQKAAPFLAEGIEYTSKRRDKTRLTFILAQLYHFSGNYAQAQSTYERVLRMNPDFDLAFQARIGMAMAYDPASGDSAYIRSELQQMLRDDKNKPYRDQIYYALAQLAMRQQNEDLAIEMYLQSTRVSEENKMQKGLSFMRLGEIFYARPAYHEAIMFYDSTMLYLPASHEHYQEIYQLNSILSQLGNSMRVIAREDSLQQLAAMPEGQRLALIDEIIAELSAREEQERAIERDRMEAARLAAQTQRQMGSGTRDAGWYFYNPSSISFGRTEFLGRYGERPLEDLWRISNKQLISFGMDMDFESDETTQQEEAGSPLSRDRYLRNIPVTPEMMLVSNERIGTAYFNKGLLFKDRLRDYSAAIESLETLLQRFPESEHSLYSYYYLYTMYKELNNSQRANIFKERIINEFPDSEFASILGDPDYLQNYRRREQKANDLYSETYQAFLSGNYERVNIHCEAADSLEMGEDLRSQFAYLCALNTGKKGQRNAFREELQYVVNRFAGQSVYQPASELLAMLSTDAGFMPATGEEFPEEMETESLFAGEMSSVYSYDPGKAHFCVFVVDSRRTEMTGVRQVISQYNSGEFPDKNLSISTIFLDERRQILTIATFPDKPLAMDYYKRFIDSEYMQSISKQSVDMFVISVDNYPVFYQEKNLEEYLMFFRKLYLNQ
jgi:tetratricopeptide (TPR) repeat protein